MKNWFSNCFPLLYICLHCDEGCICWHFGGPGASEFYVRAQQDPEKIKYLFIYFYFKTQKVFYHIASIFDMQINIKERVDVNQDGPSLIIEASPPPPLLPNSQRCFPHMKKLIIYCFLCCTYVSSVMRYSWHFSTSGFNIRLSKKKLITNFQITSIFYILLEDSFGVKSISKFSWGLEAHIKKCMSSVDPCILI